MAQDRPSSGDLFVGRKRELEQYQDFLNGETPWVMVITGVEGCGKTWLRDSLAKHTPPDICVVKPDNFCHNTLRTDPLKILEELADRVKDYCSKRQIDAFKKALKDNRKQLILRIQMIQNVIAEQDGTVQGAKLSMNVNEALEEARCQVRELAKDAFYTLMDTFGPKRLVIMLDACEWLSEPQGCEVGKWVLNGLLSELHTHMQENDRQCFVVIASRVKPQLEVIDKEDIVYLPLQMLEQAAVQEYLERIGMQDAEMRQQVYEITYGHPLCISIIGEIWQKQGDQPLGLTELQAKFYDQALQIFVKERVLERLEPPYRDWTRYGVLLRTFNLPLLQAVFSGEQPEPPTIDKFDRFINYPFIKPAINHYYAFFELLRELQMEEIRVQEPQRWKDYHKRALDYLLLVSTNLTELYYHALAWDEKEARRRAEMSGHLDVLREAARDKTLRSALSSI